jgi:omega-6 fatty acid desaturase (delta-12 desaturase)
MAATSCGCGISLQSRTAIGSHQKIVQQAVMSSSQPTMLRFPSSRHVCLSGTHLASKGISAGQSCKAKRLRLSKSITGCQVSAIATPVATPSPLNDAEERQQLAEKYGFTQIGEPVPSGITLKNVMDTFPPEVFQIHDQKAWITVLISVVSYSLGLFMIAKSPWYLLPLAWAWTGTAVTGFFVIGHDCAHKSFATNKLLEDIVGTLAFLPLIYPYEPWRFKHDRHHAKTNMLEEDTAWHPVVREEWNNAPKSMQVLLEYSMGPLRPWASIGHWLVWHFDLKKYRPSEIPRVKVSLAAVFAFMAVGWPLIIYYTGIAGWFKFWLMPWLGYHFWMSTFTMVHHTAPHIPFKDSKDWNAAAAQLGGTVHCDYPKWVEVLCHDISVHIPHHISQKIPSYNLRLAHESLVKNWGKYLNITTWNWRLMKTIMTECHFYDEEENYKSFDNGAEDKSPVIGVLRKVMPETV